MRSIQLSMLGLAAFFGAVSCGTSFSSRGAAAPGEPVSQSAPSAGAAVSPVSAVSVTETGAQEGPAPQPDKERAARALSEVVLALGALVDEPLVPIASLAQGGVSDMDAGTINPLLDNTYYRKSRELLQEARRLFDQGDYEGCLRLTQSAQEYARLSDEYAARQTAVSRADKAIEGAGNALASAAPASRSKEPYKTAQAAYAEAKAARDAEDWDGAAEAAERAMKAIEALAAIPKQAPGSIAEETSGAARSVRRAPGPRSAAAPVSAVTPPRRAPEIQDPPAAAAGSQPVQERAGQTNPQEEALPKTGAPQKEPFAFLAGGPAQSAPLTGRPGSNPRAAAADGGGPAVETPQVPLMSSPAPENRPKTPNKQAPAARDTPSVPAIAPPGAAPAAGAYDMPVVAALSAKPQMQAPADLWAPTAARVPARPEGPVTAPHIASSLEEEPSGAAGLSAQYKVQAWETSMDCLWNIAAKPWVYGDPNKWIFLYRANSSKLPNPQNPHVVPPNIVLDIPSIDGEARQGLGSWNAP